MLTLCKRSLRYFLSTPARCTRRSAISRPTRSRIVLKRNRKQTPMFVMGEPFIRGRYTRPQIRYVIVDHCSSPSQSLSKDIAFLRTSPSRYSAVRIQRTSPFFESMATG
jgi:hypothetical protein